MNVSKFLVVLIAILVVLASCEKNEGESLELDSLNTTAKEDPTGPPTGEVIDLEDVVEEGTHGAETRGANVLIFSSTTGVGNKAWKLFRYNKSILLPGYKYNAIVTPLAGDPDLYVYGYDHQSASKWRKIRQSTSYSIDLSHLWRHELKPAEEAGYFAVFGYTAARFKIEIYRENICGVEDCIPFTNSTLRIVREGTKYLITDGSSRMVMAPNAVEARKIYQVLKFYGLNRQCFVGRPGASFTYYTKNGLAPVGPLPGEDCVSFNINNIEVKEVNGRWKIVDGNHWMFDFDTNKEEAHQTLCLIKKYGFTKSCFVGRPDPSLQYMRK